MAVRLEVEDENDDNVLKRGDHLYSMLDSDDEAPLINNLTTTSLMDEVVKDEVGEEQQGLDDEEDGDDKVSVNGLKTPTKQGRFF